MGKPRSRLKWRYQGAHKRAYGDFRSLGGGYEALKAPGESLATTDPDVAASLLAARLKELQERQRDRALLGVDSSRTLAAFAAHHLRQKARSGRVTTSYLQQMEVELTRAVEHFGADRALHTMDVVACEGWMHELMRRDNGRGGTLSDRAVRGHLNSLSNMYRRAQGEKVVPPGYNPIAAMLDKPSSASRGVATFFEVHEAAAILEAAKRYSSRRNDTRRQGRAAGPVYEIIATALLTGARPGEVLGLDVSDLSFDRRLVKIQPNAHRRLKTARSERVVTMWPQLEENLRPYVFGGPGPRQGLLFPSVVNGRLITDCRKALDAIGKVAELPEGRVRMRAFRHTYSAARLQTLDRGAPVSIYTVATELGHGSTAMVERIYGHLGEIRERSEVLEYRRAQRSQATETKGAEWPAYR